MIDLHCHSTHSDGTFAPSELVLAGKKFTLFALTDHDNVDGVSEFLGSEGGIVEVNNNVRLAGIELSVEPGKGYGKFHLLGLGVNPKSLALNAFLDEIRAGRDERNLKIIAKLNSLGVNVSIDEVRRYANGKIVARPHFARVLMEKGYASSIPEAFAKYVGDGACAYVTRYHPAQAKAIEVIHASGGIAIMAHPKYWTSSPLALLKGLSNLKDLGLDGIEAYYQANNPGETVEHLRVARVLDFIITAGSDFHGANKPTIPLGMKIDCEAEIVARIVESIKKVQVAQRVQN